jgi:hypothetical protein
MLFKTLHEAQALQHGVFHTSLSRSEIKILRNQGKIPSRVTLSSMIVAMK